MIATRTETRRKKRDLTEEWEFVEDARQVDGIPDDDGDGDEVPMPQPEPLQTRREQPSVILSPHPLPPPPLPYAPQQPAVRA